MKNNLLVFSFLSIFVSFVVAAFCFYMALGLTLGGQGTEQEKQIIGVVTGVMIIALLTPFLLFILSEYFRSQHESEVMGRIKEIFIRPITSLGAALGFFGGISFINGTVTNALEDRNAVGITIFILVTLFYIVTILVGGVSSKRSTS